MSIVYVTAASLAPRHHPGIDRHEQNPVCVESVWCVSYGSTMLRTWNQGQGSDWSVRGGIDTGPLVGDVQCSIWPMTPRWTGAVCPARSVTRVGRVMALRKRNQTQQAEKNQNFIYHFHIPLSQTTAQINQKVVYTTFRPVNLETLRGGGRGGRAEPRTGREKAERESETDRATARIPTVDGEKRSGNAR